MQPAHILLIEDDPSILALLKSLLESYGHAVVCAANAPDAELAFARHAELELLLSDYNLPETTGLVLARQFTARRPDLRVIVMSGDDLERGILSEICHRGWRFLPKPMQLSDLMGALENPGP
jgi:two-component system response regulator GlrR